MRRILAILIATSLLIAACGSDDEDSSDSSTTAAAGSATSSDLASNADVPEVTIPDPVPEELTITDVKVGDGAEVKEDSVVTVNYVGKGANTGQVFDESYTRGQPATFSLDGVIEGWSQGLVGMKVGGTRELVIPAELAYGDTPQPGSTIEPGETLVFRVDLLEVESPPSEDQVAVVEDRGQPDPVVPDPLPTELTEIDDIDGSGAEVVAGSVVYIQFIAVAASSGEIVDSTWNEGVPIRVPLDETVQAWSEGMVGMKEGGRRTIVAPPSAVFSGPPPSDLGIEADETLVFIIDLVSVASGGSAASGAGASADTGATDLPGEDGATTTTADGAGESTETTAANANATTTTTAE